MATDSAIRQLAEGPETGTTMPVLFIGHGSPMNAIEDSEFSRAWAEVARSLPKPKAIIDYTKLGRSARLSVPTLDHYLPLLYVLGAQDKTDGVGFFADKVTLGSMSMRSVRLG
jgi:aromatic ring-opening dioxygenase catalytic subunit (LigB family)